MPRSTTRLACVILAAGGSSRLGRPKQLLRRRTQPLLLATVAAARAQGCAPITVVLGAEAQRLRSLLARQARGVRVVYNAAWREGMGSSVRAALPAARRLGGGTLFLVVDQPLVGAHELARLVRSWQRQPGLPIAAYYEGRAGVPAIVPNRRLRRIRMLRGDAGLRWLLRDGAMRIRLCELPEAAIDVDTPQDWARL